MGSFLLWQLPVCVSFYYHYKAPGSYYFLYPSVTGCRCPIICVGVYPPLGGRWFSVVGWREKFRDIVLGQHTFHYRERYWSWGPQSLNKLGSNFGHMTYIGLCYVYATTFLFLHCLHFEDKCFCWTCSKNVLCLLLYVWTRSSGNTLEFFFFSVMLTGLMLVGRSGCLASWGMEKWHSARRLPPDGLRCSFLLASWNMVSDYSYMESVGNLKPPCRILRLKQTYWKESVLHW